MVEPALQEPTPVCPYRGLMAYDVDDSDTYFGRDADLAACLERLSGGGVLAVVGAVRQRQVLARASRRCRGVSP